MAVADPKDESPREAPASADSSTAAPPSRARLVLRVGALGVNAWAVAVALPAQIGGIYGTADVVLVLLPLVALFLGLRALARDQAAALGLLGVGVPVLIATAMAGRADPALVDRYGTMTTILAALSLLAYVVAAADALGRPARLRETKESKLAASARARPSSRVLRALVLGTTSAFALVVAIVAPAIGSHRAAMEAWGEAADEGRVLAAIVGGAMACVAAAVIVGPALRAERSSPRTRDVALKVTLALVVAATGAIAWAILRTVSS
jgi:hypothetical protein